MQNMPVYDKHMDKIVGYTSIIKDGLEHPYLASNIGLARYYAILASENDGDQNSKPVILRIKKLDKSLLRLDNASMDEPVMADEEARDSAWNLAAKLHPEWYDKTTDTVSIPETEWEWSWDAVGAAIYDGVIPFSDIEIVES